MLGLAPKEKSNEPKVPSLIARWGWAKKISGTRNASERDAPPLEPEERLVWNAANSMLGYQGKLGLDPISLLDFGISINHDQRRGMETTWEHTTSVDAQGNPLLFPYTESIKVNNKTKETDYRITHTNAHLGDKNQIIKVETHIKTTIDREIQKSTKVTLTNSDGDEVELSLCDYGDRATRLNKTTPQKNKRNTGETVTQFKDNLVDDLHKHAAMHHIYNRPTDVLGFSKHVLTKIQRYKNPLYTKEDYDRELAIRNLETNQLSSESLVVGLLNNWHELDTSPVAASESGNRFLPLVCAGNVNHLVNKLGIKDQIPVILEKNRFSQPDPKLVEDANLQIQELRSELSTLRTKLNVKNEDPSEPESVTKLRDRLAHAMSNHPDQQYYRDRKFDPELWSYDSIAHLRDPSRYGLSPEQLAKLYNETWPLTGEDDDRINLMGFAKTLRLKNGSSLRIGVGSFIEKDGQESQCRVLTFIPGNNLDSSFAAITVIFAKKAKETVNVSILPKDSDTQEEIAVNLDPTKPTQQQKRSISYQSKTMFNNQIGLEKYGRSIIKNKLPETHEAAQELLISLKDLTPTEIETKVIDLISGYINNPRLIN